MRGRFVLTLLWAICGWPLPVLAQAVSTGSIVGYVYDQQRGALAGVTITAASADSPAPRRAVSSASGEYRVTDLPPGIYTLTAEQPGFASFILHNIRVGTGVALGLEVVMSLADVRETVDVKHDPPMLEVLRPGQAINISGDFQRDVPLTRGRDWAQFLELTPGVTATQTQTFQNYNYHGAGSESQVLQLDGMDVMSAQANSNVYVGLNTDAIADVQVKSAAADSSVPLGVGATANVVTKSGTNTLQGTASVLYQPWRWNDSNTAAGSAAAAALVQPDLSLGGPLLRDRIWFFGAYRYIDGESGINRNARQLSVLSALVPKFEPFNNRRHGSLLFAKVTQQVGQHRISGSFQYDRNPSDENTATYGTPFYKASIGGPWSTVSLTSVLHPALVGQFAVSYNSKDQFNAVADPSIPSRVVFESTAVQGGRLVGLNTLATLDSTGAVGLFPVSKVVVSADLTHARSTPWGSHDVRFGMYVQAQHEDIDQENSNGGEWYVAEVLRDPGNPALGSIPFQRTIQSPARVAFRSLRARDVAVYLQDLWRPWSRLTLAAGVRVDRISRHDVVFDRSVQMSTDVGPRFGITVSADASHRNILHATAGRVHDALPLTAASLGTSTATVRELYDRDLNGTFETEFVTPGSTQLSANRVYDASLHQPYVNEVSAGYRRQFWAETSLDVVWMRREFRDRLTSVEINGIYENAVFTGYRDEKQNAILLVTNNRWNWPNYNAVSIQVAKRAKSLQVLGSYTRQWNSIGGTWQPNDVSSFIQPDAFANNRESPTTWRDHSGRVAATVRLPWGMQLAADYTIQAGRWSGPITTTIAEADARFGPRTVVLGNGRTVSNPLATTTRFAYTTRGEGQLRAGTLHLGNVRVAHDTRVAFGTVRLSVDVFNVTNAGADQSFASTLRTASTFGLGTNRQLPRAAQIGVRLSF